MTLSSSGQTTTSTAATITTTGPSTVTRWNYPPEFKVKEMSPPPAPDALFLPTFYGPNYEGKLDGALLTPATVRGVVDDDGTVRDVPVASVKFTLTAQDIISEVNVGILPYKENS